MNPDTPENRIYIQRNRLWLLGEIIVMKLMREHPKDPIAAAVAALEAEELKPTTHIDPPTPEDAQNAKSYLQEHNIAMLIEQWFKETLEAKPEKPLPFSVSFFKKQMRGGAAEASAASGGGSAGDEKGGAAQDTETTDAAAQPEPNAEEEGATTKVEPAAEDAPANGDEENLMDEL